MKESSLWENAGKILDELLGLERTTVSKTMDLGDILNELKENTPPKHWSKERSRHLPKLKADKDERARKCANNRDKIGEWLEDDPDATLTEILEKLKGPKKRRLSWRTHLKNIEQRWFDKSHENWTSGQENPELKQKRIDAKYRMAAGVVQKARTARFNEHFLDSGAFSLFDKEAGDWGLKNPKDPWGFYNSEDFFGYMDSYADFVKKNKSAIDFYANVDAIGNPEISWRNQKYLESHHDLNPVPVVHEFADPKWLEHYLNRGHTFIGLSCKPHISEKAEKWLDECFKMICDENGKPKIKVHGFGICDFRILRKFPWWSADATTWRGDADRGKIWIPQKDDQGNLCFDENPDKVYVAAGSRKEGFVSSKLDETTKKKVGDWLSSIGVPFGKNNEGGIEVEGVINSDKIRIRANVIFMEMFRTYIAKNQCQKCVAQNKTTNQPYKGRHC